MSDPRIAVVAEGPTDIVVIEAALKALLQRPFLLNQLQPEPTRPDMGNGWGGVFKWCQEFRQRGAVSIEADPTLSQFDLVIVHLDADVADKNYADCGNAVLQASLGLARLPCAQPCPPPVHTVAALEAVLLSWLGLAATGPKSLFCIPSKATEAWLAAAVLPQGHALHDGLECRLDLESQLAKLSKKERIRKTGREYQSWSQTIAIQWAQVTARCSQATAFEQQIHNAARNFPV
ncbi:hypothetical protein [Acidovorax sp. Root267]|uniref:hypothetical protein n=1 Tax=Acidovorax sp. Root267 TaxID=1736505 RepID=UPI0009EB4CAD|nr:hypothetical protein [Acidovorax sp. Root267]